MLSYIMGQENISLMMLLPINVKPKLDLGLIKTAHDKMHLSGDDNIV